MTTLTPLSGPVGRLGAHRSPIALIPAGATTSQRKRATFETKTGRSGRHLDTARAGFATALIGLGASTATAVALMIGLGR